MFIYVKRDFYRSSLQQLIALANSLKKHVFFAV